MEESEHREKNESLNQDGATLFENFYIVSLNGSGKFCNCNYKINLCLINL